MMIFQDNLIITKPNYTDTRSHSHFMIHLIVSDQPISVFTDGGGYSGNTVFIDSFVEHRVHLPSKNTLVFLIDPCAMSVDLLHGSPVIVTNNHHITQILTDRILRSPENCALTVLKHFGIRGNIEFNDMDHRVEAVIKGIKNGYYLDKNVADIALSKHLSEGRLSHLFTDSTGVNLKNYLLIHKLKAAFENINLGMTITEAAHMAGFFDSSHLSRQVLNMTGINISEILGR